MVSHPQCFVFFGCGCHFFPQPPTSQPPAPNHATPPLLHPHPPLSSPSCNSLHLLPLDAPTLRPRCSHNTVMDPVKGPRFVFLLEREVSIENTSCVWGRKLARQQRPLYSAHTMRRGSQWRHAETLPHHAGLQQMRLKDSAIKGQGEGDFQKLEQVSSPSIKKKK